MVLESGNLVSTLQLVLRIDSLPAAAWYLSSVGPHSRPRYHLPGSRSSFDEGHPILFSQIVDQILLLTMQPSGHGEDEEL